VGEKAAHSLEPLLATPITTIELLTGKALAAAIPAVVATWLSYLIYAFIAYFLATPVVFRAILQPMWLLAIFVVGPLLTLLAVCVAIIVSSRVTDPRVAEQLSMVVMLPIIMVIIGQSVGVVLLDSTMVILLGVVVLVLDVVLGYISIRAFQRENILTRWK
jgi:ABC-2 type transport system permease protein